MKSLISICMVAWTVTVVSCKTPHIPVTCKKISPCVCRDETGKYVDLRSLAKKNGAPKFLDYPTAGGDSNLYSFNPCYGFNEGENNSLCRNVSVCQANKDKTRFMAIGEQDTAQFSHGDNGNLSLVFGSSLNRYKITTFVILYCAEDVEDGYFRVIGDIGNHSYWLQLRSKHCCPKNESEIKDLDELLGVNNSWEEMTMPTMTSHSVVTMTTSPDIPGSIDVIVVILFCILVVAVMILAALAGAVLYYRARHPMFGKNVYYHPVDNDDEEYDVHFDQLSTERGKEDKFKNDVYGHMTS
ncbi:uncharacterized protein LOC110466576 [Mizuhopecten yessoensis]|uniref:MRH domain-containing protein n=1 Tax=Mizuhopecten yessoensis TaxID=6573 RepID=A0A210PP01_MIZYE|nr:uncharacterized protein LOC110466576 [Mizuhopecten yessoensis]OWF38203.1 hypothetical protein KP79_PYT19414 [Mizuhopecten yessoensis]